VAIDLCERAVLLFEGRIVEDLSMRELLKHRSLLERFGFDADYAEWMCGKESQISLTSNSKSQPRETRDKTLAKDI
jgi:hypothetical protein